MRSAGINFGIPESEWILEVEEDGSNPRGWNPVTGEELRGGGGGDKYAPYDFVIWNHFDANSDDWIYEAVKGTFAELKTTLLSGALVVGLYADTGVSGDWVNTKFSDTLWVQYNPSRDAVVIRGVVCDSNSAPSQLHIAWDSNGIFYDD